MKYRIHDVLSASTRAQKICDLSLGRGRQTTIWENSHDEVCYLATQGHVFSLYLKGGSGTHYITKNSRQGAPNTMCVLPQGHSSAWRIEGSFTFLHLFVADHVLRSEFAMVHDQDARRLDIAEHIFIAPGKFEKPLRFLAKAAANGDALAGDIGFAHLVAALGAQRVRLSGGLSAKARRDVIAWTYANLEATIRLVDLARVAGLSTFHFHEMFCQSFGVSPHLWLLHLRVKRATEMMAFHPLAEITYKCGFSSQAHFTRIFKKQIGVTPGQYRKMIA